MPDDNKQLEQFMKRVMLTTLAILAALLLAGCASPDNAAELKSAAGFCAKQDSKVEAIHLWTGEGSAFRVECRNGVVAE